MVETDTTPGDVGEPSFAEKRSRAQIFVSFRIDPDEGLALALQALIRGSIEPAPEVYVSSAGGLAPSSKGLREQLRDAVQEAKAFVAVITEQSKTREWILYEAGAAWGRNVVYAPVLFDVDPADLPGTYMDYFAVRAQTRGEMHGLIKALAREIGRSPKSHFGTRYAAFKRAIEEHATDTDDEPWWKEDPVYGLFMPAMLKWVSGEKREAQRMFEELLRQLEGNDEKAYWLYRWISFTAQGLERFDKATKADEEVKSSAWHAMMMGEFDPVPSKAAACYHLARERSKSGTPVFREASLGLIRTLCESGNRPEASRVLLEGMTSNDRELQAALGAAFPAHWGKSDPYCKLLMSVFTLLRPTASGLYTLVDTALECRMASIALHAGNLLVDIDPNGSHCNQLGRVYSELELKSKAYAQFGLAFDKGASVALANMASLVGYYANPAAALATLERHTEPFDSSDPSHPFTLRAEFESALHKENLDADRCASVGREYSAHLLRYAERAVQDGGEQAPAPAVKYEIVLRGGIRRECSLEKLEPLPNAWRLKVDGADWGIAQVQEDGALIAIVFPREKDALPWQWPIERASQNQDPTTSTQEASDRGQAG